MFAPLSGFASFSVTDLARAKEFYGGTLGLSISERAEGLDISLPGGTSVFVYHSATNKPGDFTVLHFAVADVEATVDFLVSSGVTMEHYDMETFKTDAKGIAHGDGAFGPKSIAWFKDPSGNIVAVLQD